MEKLPHIVSAGDIIQISRVVVHPNHGFLQNMVSTMLVLQYFSCETMLEESKARGKKVLQKSGKLKIAYSH